MQNSQDVMMMPKNVNLIQIIGKHYRSITENLIFKTHETQKVTRYSLDDHEQLTNAFPAGEKGKYQ